MREIINEHRALDSVFATALKLLGEGRIGPEARDIFEDLRDSLESHLSAEEDLYFPTIWQLRPKFEGRLRAFIRAHHHFRGLIQEIAGLMACHEWEAAAHVLERLKDEFARHESAEETTVGTLDMEIQAAASR